MADKVDCPVCGNKYSTEEIANHVDKCLFLNSSNEKNLSSKRSNLPTPKGQSPNLAKRLKTEVPESSAKDFKVTSQVMEANESFSMQYNDQSDVTHGNLKDNNAPLAELMRPYDISQFVGQRHVLGRDKILFKLIQNENIPSMILWGPPGCGKTTLAHIIAEKTKHCINPFKFIKLSATMDGVKDVKEIVKLAKNELSLFKRKTLLFMDEIHRFNKLQQDIFLPHVESGLITLIGATTENPSFSLNSALLSRCAVIVLEKLSSDDLYSLLCRAVYKLRGIVEEQENAHNSEKPENQRFSIDDASLHWLSEMCDGDARMVLNSLSIALQTVNCSSNVENKLAKITLEQIKDGVKRSHMLYDRKGDEHYNTISALHKSLRAGDDNATLYWLARMLEGGEDPMFIARRLVRAASEDVGLADPRALQLAVATMQGCQLIGMPECDVLLAQCAVYLSRAPKSREMDSAIAKAKESVKTHKGPLPPIPLHLRNAPTGLMKDLGYSKGYNMLPKEKSGLTYLPDCMQGVNFFQ